MLPYTPSLYLLISLFNIFPRIMGFHIIEYHYLPIGARTIPPSQLSRIRYNLKTIEDETCGAIFF